jgi:hypothetical protein
MAFLNKFSHFRGEPSELAWVQGCPGLSGKDPGPEFYNYPLPLIRHTGAYISSRVDRNASVLLLK